MVRSTYRELTNKKLQLAITLTMIAWFVLGVCVAVKAQPYTFIVDLAWNTDGDFIATVDNLGTVQVYDAATQQLLLTLENNGPETSIAWRPSDSNQLAIATYKQGTRIVDATTGNTLYQFATQPYTHSVSFSPDGSYLLTGNSTPELGPAIRGYIQTIEIATRNSPTIFEEIPQRVVSALWSPDGQYVAGLGVGDMGEVIIWDASTGSVIHRISVAQEATDGISIFPVGDIRVFAWSPDGSILAAGDELQVTFWNAGTFDQRTVSEDLYGGFYDIDWSPDSQTLAAPGDFGRVIRFVDVNTGEITYTLPTNQRVRSIAYSPDGTKIAYAGGETKSFVIIPVPDLQQDNSL